MNQNVILGMRCRTNMRAVLGSRPMPCSQCDCDVMISPAGRDRIERESLSVLCMECAADKLGAEKQPIQMMPITTDQLNEIDAFYRGYN